MIRTDPGSRSLDQIPESVSGIHGHVWSWFFIVFDIYGREVLIPRDG